MTALIPAFGLGVVTGLRSMTGLAAVSWAVRSHRLPVGGRVGAVLGHAATAWSATALAGGELVADKLPGTPDRTAAVPFAARVGIGAGCGAAVGSVAGQAAAGSVAGGVEAVVGTLGGYHARAALAEAFAHDLPAAMLEDAVAVGAAIALLWTMRPTTAAGRTVLADPPKTGGAKMLMEITGGKAHAK